MKNEIPDSNELEITLFGAGYGESVVIHVGDGKWIIIDSAMPSNSQEPYALKYLKDIGVDIASQVIGVIITHWHDDHIRGISEIAEKCVSAQFYISAALTNANNHKQFLKLILDSSIQRRANITVGSISGVNEFSKLLKTLKDRNDVPNYADQGKLLLSGPNFALFALSPHKEVFNQAIDSILSLIPSEGEVERIPAPKANQTSVVLWLRFGNNIRALLGADLEENKEHKGWSLILSRKQDFIIDKKADLFKIPHHGSITGHHEDVWKQLLNDNPICLIAPFRRGIRLPKKSDVNRITKFTNNLYITHSDIQKPNFKAVKDKHVRRRLVEVGAIIPEQQQQAFNYIKTRKKFDEDWNISLSGLASLLSSSKF